MMISWLINTSTFFFLVISFSDYGTFPTCIYFIFELSPFHRLKACQNKKKGKYNKIETKQSKSQKYDKASYNAKGGGDMSQSHTRGLTMCIFFFSYGIALHILSIIFRLVYCNWQCKSIQSFSVDCINIFLSIN